MEISCLCSVLFQKPSILLEIDGVEKQNDGIGTNGKFIPGGVLKILYNDYPITDVLMAFGIKERLIAFQA